MNRRAAQRKPAVCELPRRAYAAPLAFSPRRAYAAPLAFSPRRAYAAPLASSPRRAYAAPLASSIVSHPLRVRRPGQARCRGGRRTAVGPANLSAAVQIVTVKIRRRSGGMADASDLTILSTRVGNSLREFGRTRGTLSRSAWWQSRAKLFPRHVSTASSIQGGDCRTSTSCVRIVTLGRAMPEAGRRRCRDLAAEA